MFILKVVEVVPSLDQNTRGNSLLYVNYFPVQLYVVIIYCLQQMHYCYMSFITFFLTQISGLEIHVHIGF